MIDTSARLEIHASPWRMLLLLLLAIGFVVLGAVIAFPSYFGVTLTRGNSLLGVVAGWASMLFFGLCAMTIAWQLATTRGPVVSLAPDGFSDVRVAAGRIPWTAIQDVRIWTYGGERILILAVAPEIEAGLGLTAIARMTRGANAALGADGLAIATRGLAISCDDLVAATRAYRDAYGVQSADAA